MARDKKDNQQPPQPIRASRNTYVMNNRDMSSPYVANYYAARAQRQEFKPQPMPAMQRQQRPRVEEYYDDLERGVNVGKAKTRTKQLKPKRGFIVIVLLILILAYVAVAALSFFKVLPEYTAIFKYNSDVVLATENENTEEETEAEAAEDDEASNSNENTTTTASENEENAETTEEDEKAVEISNRDVIMGFVKSFVKMDNEESHFYNSAMSKVKDADTVTKIAYYALPIAYVLALLIAVVFLIRLIVSAFTPKRRKFFILSSVLLLVLNIVVAFAGYIWSVGGTNFAHISNYITFIAKEAIPVQLGMGSIILLGISLIAFIFSFFAFRSKKKVQ